MAKNGLNMVQLLVYRHSKLENIGRTTTQDDAEDDVLAFSENILHQHLSRRSTWKTFIVMVCLYRSGWWMGSNDWRVPSKEVTIPSGVN